MKLWQLALSTWAALTFGNYVWAAAVSREFMKAAERSYFQGVAIAVFLFGVYRWLK